MTPKMKPEEALFLFNNMEFAEKYQGKDEYAEVSLVIKQALEKQTPEKPIVYKMYDTGKVVGYVCPKCKCDEIYSGIYRYDYCRDCGQAIDWSEEE